MSSNQKDFFFYIDVVGSCNLRCPSCPVGNSLEVKNPTGFMKPELLKQIMEKAKSECNLTGVGLFNWTEPLLHPQLPELVRVVQSFNVPCQLSSNLNILKNADELMAANPYSFRVSVSGFNQAVYGITHRGGNIERVKANMIALAEAKSKNQSDTKIHVCYHRYLGNLDDEILMKNFAASLEFEFQPVWAYMLPLEKVMAFAYDDPNEATLTNEDHELIEKLALPLSSAIAASENHKEMSCSMRDNQMILDYQGNVQLCCAVYDANKYTLAPFPSTPLADLQNKKYASSTCTKCMDKGIHVYYHAAAPEFHSLGQANLRKYYLNQAFLNFQEVSEIEADPQESPTSTSPDKFSTPINEKIGDTSLLSTIKKKIAKALQMIY